mmetsp:Transcript_57436/g.115299  ORF Transcript_57436/g.115299 Transcript_57436/m.115299 type:complete len:80 (-) Transcript_57436:59-298(-)
MRWWRGLSQNVRGVREVGLCEGHVEKERLLFPPLRSSRGGGLTEGFSSPLVSADACLRGADLFVRKEEAGVRRQQHGVF